MTSHDDPQFEAWLARVAPSVNEPPATPRDAMWDAIAARGRMPGRTAVAGHIGARRWVLPAAIAAALVAGVVIDRAFVRATTPLVPPPVAVAPVPAQPQSPPEDLYRLAAEQTLSQAEALLVAYKASGPAAPDTMMARRLGTWGRDVLSSTRLLLDSPAGQDPMLRELLNDVELALVQVIRLSGTPLDDAERALIDRALQEHDLLPRIRSTVPAGVPGAGSDD